MRLPASNFPPRYNVAPTDQVPIVRVDPRDGTRELVMTRWGLIPGWMKEKPKVPHINARAEMVHKLLPLFREAFAKRRALMPATASNGRRALTEPAVPVRPPGHGTVRFRRPVGVHRLGGEDILSATIIVGKPNPLVAGVHDPMPVMLMTKDYDPWLEACSCQAIVPAEGGLIKNQ